jgi:hypothetical protein
MAGRLAILPLALVADAGPPGIPGDTADRLPGTPASTPVSTALPRSSPRPGTSTRNRRGRTRA